jgi:type IV pilus assembly protein PilM
MSILAKIKSFVMDPPAEYVFEVSEAGIAWVNTQQPASVQWAPLPEGVIVASPLEDNVKQPEQYAAAVRAIVPPLVGKKRRAALILPDYCARVAVVDFDTFPSEPEDQLQLARFRVKRVVPFDIDSASVACYPQTRQGGSKKIDVVVAVINQVVATHLEAPFRAVGFQCGFVTLSALSALSLKTDGEPEQTSPAVVAKLSGNVLSLCLMEGKVVRMVRCVQLHGSGDLEEATDLMATTFAYAEDELGARPKVLRLCGLPRESDDLKQAWSDEFGLPVTGLHSRFGTPGAYNSGLYGYLESMEAS